ncbi:MULTISPECIES: hypothetical protein [unclassified Mesorhizobium]|uniref:hypothetical protein n=1 Tax=unclassified Mesorhizobium TaxID=325217 RepID=UPI000FDB2EF4|nr:MULTISPECIES: hypothetical protein [unclassified Mesorhizobium]TGT64049.1 hypothetical protein EN809_034910 [Mesorhizobium sp. M2E.F.Ca.ET.166.01.1.1]TGV97067.1 hypothetical protein EN797_035250 [Mesorhizobium sp. M2E.F.Ca.ET.154.01.1.1]
MITKAEIQKAVPFISEEVEPFAALYIGKMFARCEKAREAGDETLLYDLCCSMWWGLNGLQHIATAISTATHFTIALSNHQRQIADYIREHTGVDPWEAKGWGNHSIDRIS